MAKFKKGNKLGGRTKGSKNKVTQDIRKAFQNLLEDNLEQITKDFNAIVEPEKRIKLYLDLAQYCLPKLRSVEAEVNTGIQATDFKISDLYKMSDFESEVNNILDDLKEKY